MQAILLAAGFGTRLKPYTLLRPKPLFPVLNQPLLLHALAQLEAAGCDRIIVNCHHLAEQIEATLAARPSGRVEILLQKEAEILGTGGSLREALPRLADAPLLVMNGDIFHDIDLRTLWNAHQAGECGVTMALHDLPRFNTVRVVANHVAGFGKDIREGEEILAFTGVQVVNPEIIQKIPAGRFFHVIDLYQELAPTGLIAAHRVDGAFWQDMGTPQDYLDLHKKQLQPGEWRIDESAQMAPDAELSGCGCIGAHAVIGKGARLTNCVVWDYARIPENARFTGRILTGYEEIDEAK